MGCWLRPSRAHHPSPCGLAYSAEVAFGYEGRAGGKPPGTASRAKECPPKPWRRGTDKSSSFLLLGPLFCFARPRFAGKVRLLEAKHDALRGFSEIWPLMHYVYLIESIADTTQRYVGIAANLKRRLQDHNSGKSSHTTKAKPWRLVTYVAFSDNAKAASFERYLKSGSGHAFAKKRLW